MEQDDLRFWEQGILCAARPYPNEHAARLKSPDDFDPDTFRRKADGTIYGSIKVPATADVIWGKLKGKSGEKDYPVPQAIRFPMKDWTEAEARKWLKDNDVKYILFEPASGGKEQPLSDETKQRIYGHIQTRTFPIVRENIDAANRTARLSFSSEAPVLRWYGIEILSHKPEDIRMERWKAGAPFLMDHNPRDQRGIIQEGKLNADKKLEGTVLVSRHQRGEELFVDMQDGIRPYTSIGYAVHNLRELQPAEMSAEITQLCLENKCGAFVAAPWEPLEGSSVSIPADMSVGLGRSLEEYYSIPAAASSDGGAERDKSQSTHIIQRGVNSMEPDEKVAKTPVQPPTQEELERVEAERKQEIEAVGKRFEARIRGGKEKMDELVKDALELKRSAELFKGDVYLRVNDTKPLETPLSFLDMSAKDQKRYRLRNVILAQMKRREGGKIRDVLGNEVDTTFEEECSAEVAKKVGPSSRGGLYVPFDIQQRQTLIDPNHARYVEAFLRENGMSLRDLTVGAPTAGGNLVATNLLAGSFIDLLQNKSLFFQLGVQRLTGLIGNVAFPRKTAAGTFYWVAENTAPAAESAPAFDQVTMSPNEGGMYEDYSRRLLLQATPSIDLLVQNDIVSGCALGFDKSIAHGTGGTQPQGIIGTSGIGSVTGAGFGWEQAVEFETDVAVANGDIGTMAFVMGAAARGILKTRLKALNTAEFLIDRDQRMNGYPVNVTNQMDAGYILFGVFSQALVGEWNTLDLLVDPYTGSSVGTIRVRAFIAVDVAVPQPGAFSACSDLS